MYAKRRIYNKLRKMDKDDTKTMTVFSFYGNIMSADNIGAFMQHFQNIISTIIEHGTAIPIPKTQRAKRKKLGLPPVKFDNEEIKKLSNRIEGVSEEGDD